MGYGIGSDHVNVSVSLRKDDSLADLLEDLHEALASLFLAGCNKVEIEVHNRGAVVTGNRAIAPAPVEPDELARPIREVFRL
jgi:hypothetical protein